MIKKLKEWYRGYTDEQEKELNDILNFTKELALQEASKQLNENIEENYIYTDFCKVVNTNYSFYKPINDDILRQLLLLDLPNSTIKVSLFITKEDKTELRFDKEYCLSDIISYYIMNKK